MNGHRMSVYSDGIKNFWQQMTQMDTCATGSFAFINIKLLLHNQIVMSLLQLNWFWQAPSNGHRCSIA